MRQLVRVISLGVLLATASLGECASGADVRVTETDTYVLLDHLLALSEKGDRSTQLYRHKQWVSLHEKFSSPEELSKEQMRVYLFMAFIATEKVMINTLEEIAQEIVPRFRKQGKLMLDVLNESPFLVTAVCDNINEHFFLFGTPLDKRKFLDDYRKLFAEGVREERLRNCLASDKRDKGLGSN